MFDNLVKNKKIVTNTFYLTIRMLFVLGVSLYTSRVFLAALGVEDFGIYNVVGGFVTMFAFLNNAMTTGVQRFYNVELGKNGIKGSNKVYISSILSQSVLAGILLVLTETIGLWYMYNEMVIPANRLESAVLIFHFSVGSLVVNIMSVPYSGIIMAHEKMNYFALVSILDVLLKLGVALILPSVTTDRLVVYGFLMLLITILDFFMYSVYARLNFKEIRFVKCFHKRLLVELLSFSSWNVLGKVAIMLKEQGLNMVLNLFFGPVVNAARGVAFQVNGALAGFVNNINVAVKPQLTQAYAQGEKQRTFSLMFSISKLCYIILLLMAVPICMEIDFILKLWLGDNVPKYTAIFIVLVVATTFVNNLNAPVSFVVHAIGKMKKYQTITSAIELFILPVSYLILKTGGEPWVVFIIGFFFVLLGQIFSLFILKELEDYSILSYFKSVIIPLIIITLGGVLFAYIPSMIMMEGIVRLLLVSCVSTIAICLLSYMLVLNDAEKIFLRRILQTKHQL